MRLYEIIAEKRKNKKIKRNIDVSNASVKDTGIKTATGFITKSTFNPKDFKSVGGKLNDEISNFYKHKATQNILSPYGKRDGKFSSKGPLRGFYHVHLSSININPPLILIYKINGTVLELYMLTQHKYDTTYEEKKLANKLKKAV